MDVRHGSREVFYSPPAKECKALLYGLDFFDAESH